MDDPASRPSGAANRNPIDRQAEQLYRDCEQGLITEDQYATSIYTLVKPPLLAVITHTLGWGWQRQDSLDVFQEVMILFFRATLDPTEVSIMPWLYKAAKHKSIDALRRSAVRTHALFNEQIPKHGLTLHPMQSDGWLREKVFREAFGALPPDEVFSLVMFYYDNQRLTEIAAALGVSSKKVEQYLRSAKEHLFEMVTVRELWPDSIPKRRRELKNA